MTSNALARVCIVHAMLECTVTVVQHVLSAVRAGI